MRALKAVYGWNISYEKILEKSGISTLKTRREEIFLRFAHKCSKDTRFSHWFPPALVTGHETRKRDRFAERRVRTERLRKSPVMTMIRELNKEEKNRRQK